jgi:hypothetical protein
LLWVSVVLSFPNSFQSKDSHRYGAKAGVIRVEGCRQVSDFCEVRFVDIQDPTKPCAALEPNTTVLATDSTTATITNPPSSADNNKR